MPGRTRKTPSLSRHGGDPNGDPNGEPNGDPNGKPGGGRNTKDAPVRAVAPA
jgi:hypothetical protein